MVNGDGRNEKDRIMKLKDRRNRVRERRASRDKFCSWEKRKEEQEKKEERLEKEEDLLIWIELKWSIGVKGYTTFILWNFILILMTKLPSQVDPLL